MVISHLTAGVIGDSSIGDAVEALEGISIINGDSMGCREM